MLSPPYEAKSNPITWVHRNRKTAPTRRNPGSHASRSKNFGLGELMRAIEKDEARWCAMLAGHLRMLGQPPSSMLGAFYEKAVAISDLGERIAFLNRGQGWVVRKLRELLPRVRDNSLHSDLSEMLRSHEANIALAAEVSRSAHS